MGKLYTVLVVPLICMAAMVQIELLERHLSFTDCEVKWSTVRSMSGRGACSPKAGSSPT